MAWTSPSDKTTGDVVTAAIWNAQLGTTGNMAQTAPAKVTTAGDMVYATGANTLTRLAIGSTGDLLTVSGGVPAWSSAGSNPFDGIRAQFRASRRVYAELVAMTSSDGTYSTIQGFGGNIGLSGGTPSLTFNAATGTTDAYLSMVTGTSAQYWWGSNTGGSSNTSGMLRPDKNPRMLIRFFPGSSNANLSTTFAGFVAAGVAIGPTMGGAYLRANTTGNLFFVTRQGASEATTDLGARPTAPTSYEIYTEDAGVTWKCRNDTTGAEVASHTSNVPTATTVVAYGFGGSSSSGAINCCYITYFRVEAGTGAA